MIATENKAIENNEDTREKLAEEVVDSWDMDDLIYFALKRLTEDYEKDGDLFEEDWATMFPEE